MFSYGLLILASIVALATVVNGSPVSKDDSSDLDLIESWDRKHDDDFFDWLDDRREGYRTRYSEKEKNVEFFLYLIKSLKSSDGGSKSVDKLFKSFVKAVWERKYKEQREEYQYKKYGDSSDDTDFRKHNDDSEDRDYKKYTDDSEENDYKKRRDEKDYKKRGDDSDEYNSKKDKDDSDEKDYKPYRKGYDFWRKYRRDNDDHGVKKRREDRKGSYFKKYTGIKEERYIKEYGNKRRNSVYKKYGGDSDDDRKDWDVYNDKDYVFDKFDDYYNEESSKKLFLVYLKFKSHCKAQTEVERSRGKREEKAKKQFSLYSELISFVEVIKSKKEVSDKFSKFLDSDYKSKFTSFKNCFFRQECGKDYDDDKDFDLYKGDDWGYHLDDGKKYDEEGRRFALFLKLRKFVKQASDRSSRYVKDIFSDWDDDDDDDDEDLELKDKHPILRYITYLQKHLSDSCRRDFWEKDDRDSDESRRKAIFFSLKAYKEFREERYMQTNRKNLEQVFGHFIGFIEFQEDVERTKNDFFKFNKWQENKENKLKVEEFAEYLKKVATYRKFVSDKDAGKRKSYQYGKKESSENAFGKFLSSSSNKDKH